MEQWASSYRSKTPGMYLLDYLPYSVCLVGLIVLQCATNVFSFIFDVLLRMRFSSLVKTF